MTKDAESTDDLNSDTSRIPNMPLSGKPPKISTKSEEEPKHTDKDSGRRTIDYTPHDSPIDSTSSWPRYTSTKHKQYIRISRQAWNIFLKYQVCLRPKTDKTIIIDFHDTWDALVQNNTYNALRQRPGIGYHNYRQRQNMTTLHPSHQRPTGLEWKCIGKVQPLDAHIHASTELQQLIHSKTLEWALSDDWTDLHIEISQSQWDKLEIRTIAYRSTIYTSGYFFQTGTRKRQIDVFEARLHDVFTMPKTNKYPRPDTPRQRQQQDRTKTSSSTCVELRYTHSERTQDARQKTSTAIQFLNRSYPIDDTVWHHPNDMADTSWHGVHPWSWRNNTKHCNMTKTGTNQHMGTKSIYQRHKSRQPHHAHRWIRKRQTDNQ
jgi:hypothetical protein